MLIGGGVRGSGIVEGPQGLPWPTGDPDQLQTSAQHAQGMAEELDRQRNRLVASGREVNPWSGMAHNAYVSELDRHARAADQVSSGLRDTSTGLNGLSGVLRNAHEVIRRQASLLADAREQAQRATQRGEHARAEATAAHQRAAASAPVSGGMDPAAQEAQAAEDSACAAENEAARARQHAAEVEQRAQAEAQRACEDVQRQDSQSEGLIEASKVTEALSGVLGLAIGKGVSLTSVMSGAWYPTEVTWKPHTWFKGLIDRHPLTKAMASAEDAFGSKLAGKARIAGRGLTIGGAVVGFGASFASQWMRDASKHPNMDTDEQVGRATTEGVSAAAGGAAGAYVGAAIGTAVCPVIGTMVGGVIGGAVGGWAATKFNDPAVQWVGNQVDKAGDAVGDAANAAKDWVGDKAGDFARTAGKTWDAVTPW